MEKKKALSGENVDVVIHLVDRGSGIGRLYRSGPGVSQFNPELMDLIQGGCSRAPRRLTRSSRREMVSGLHRQKYA